MILLEGLYLFNVALLAAYGLNCLLHTWLYWRLARRPVPPAGETAGPAEAPMVTVQLPVYNERYVVGRLIKAAVRLEWPAERLHIQVLDDSTDETGRLVAAGLARHAGQSIRLEHVRRPERQGFKAGALQQGLKTAGGEFIAIFDADFIPPPDFLQKTIPCFDPARGGADVGCVQVRWGHLNAASSALTQAQALGIDGHFMVEQAARAAAGAFMNFNGTAGVWRRACLEAAGGWQGDTLTEDLDLSYRAQLAGWRIVYQPEVVVPAELPVQVDGFKRQQFRWAKGSIQTAMKLTGRLWRARQPWWRKVLGTLHLTNYVIHPLMVLNLLLTLPLSWSNSPLLRLAPFFMLSAAGPPVMYWAAMRAQKWPRQVCLGRLLVLVMIGTGLSLNNSRAVLEAVLGIPSAFKRTPKFAVAGREPVWQASAYALPRDPTAWLELALALYAWGLLAWSSSRGIWWLFFWLLLYAGGYTYIAGLAFWQSWQTGK
ncbi:MAG: glycosyltransferase [Chloroflexi bacterium]|nr:glycosyltransferase [Chloroflexota bacterium]MCI0578024.1 glycosyltransferase [Chloroflexota bacterium]MCI0644762.1 glycosyltransferase [Chloroflexota bacterium]MCI0728667.1 glycosyltransferase [Chloroflexota bacterium]